MQCKIDDKGKSDQTDDADWRALSIDCNPCKRAGGESNDGDNDGCLCHWLDFILKANFIRGASGDGGD